MTSDLEQLHREALAAGLRLEELTALIAERDQLREENERLRALMTTCGDCVERDRFRAALEELVGPRWEAAYDAVPERRRRAARNHDYAKHRGTTP